jgi:hypothetical protein
MGLDEMRNDLRRQRLPSGDSQPLQASEIEGRMEPPPISIRAEHCIGGQLCNLYKRVKLKTEGKTAIDRFSQLYSCM